MGRVICSARLAFNAAATTLAAMKSLLSLIFAAILWAVVAAPSGAATETRAHVTQYTTSTIYVDRDGLVPGETTWVAIEQKLKPKWHVFWKNPGDAGLPLALEWRLPDGFVAGEILHPTPEVAPIGPFANFVHNNAPIFLTSIPAPKDLPLGEEIPIVVDASWQVCEEVCVPEEARFEFALPVAIEAESANQDLFARARATLPIDEQRSALFSKENGAFVLNFPWSEEAAPEDAFFFPEPEGLIKPSAAQSFSLSDGQLRVTMTPGFVADYAEADLPGVFTYVAEGALKGLTIAASVDRQSMATPTPSPSLGTQPRSATGALWFLLLMALLGGALLNLMPCVFPIVFVKATSLVKAAHHDQAVMRAQGLAYTVGVLASFLLIGGILLALRAGGEQLGWGFHLQSPIVVMASAYVLFLVGLNLSGVFHVGESIQGMGSSLASRSGLSGSFFTGALTVVVAAPCVGPLLSAPMGAAVMLPTTIGLSIFLLMALGLAAPYLLLSFVPGLGSKLPAPGPWMDVFKQLFAFPVYGAAAFFLWVFVRQSGVEALGGVLVGAVFLALAAWAFQQSKGEHRFAMIGRAASAIFLLVALFPLFAIGESRTEAATPSQFGAFAAEPYNAEAIERYRAEGKSVFVDYTADWCITCQFDKFTIFSSDALAASFKERDVVFMVADWTVRDPEITQSLNEFGASGVPFYVYHPSDGAAQVLDIPISERKISNLLAAQ